MGERVLVRWGRGRGGDPRRGGVCSNPPAAGGGMGGAGTDPVGKGNEKAGNVSECCTYW